MGNDPHPDRGRYGGGLVHRATVIDQVEGNPDLAVLAERQVVKAAIRRINLQGMAIIGYRIKLITNLHEMEINA